jgi:hypothetical protein
MPRSTEHVEHFEAWLHASCAGRMEYSIGTWRRVGRALLAGAQSVIIVAPPKPAQKIEPFSYYADGQVVMPVRRLSSI